MKKIVIIGIVMLSNSICIGQKINWQNMDLLKDHLFGVSTQKAYDEILKNKKPKRVLIAVVDSGVDTLQEDLKGVLWTDPKTGGHGWNYIGTETGVEDITNLIKLKQAFYDSLGKGSIPEANLPEYKYHLNLMLQLDSKIAAMQMLVDELKNSKKIVDLILKKMGKDRPSISDFRLYNTTDEQEKVVLRNIINRLCFYSNWNSFYTSEITDIIEMANYHVAHGLNPKNAELDSTLGNSDISQDKLGIVSNPNTISGHGTHVSGIIGALRGNGIGIDGIADDVQIIMLKENGTIREMRDEALARAIRFAVDHGAKVINLSFGKSYTWNKKTVDDAVKYAMRSDVLIVHAAGNAGKNLDLEEHYPNPVYADKSGIAPAWIEVGASGPKDDETLFADFSNYGKREVDVFAPGVEICSTLPYGEYQSWSGTSMAAPVVAGVAGLIREYYPELTAVQVKEIIMRTVIKRDVLKDKCVSGGVVNAYSALQLAAVFK